MSISRAELWDALQDSQGFCTTAIVDMVMDMIEASGTSGLSSKLQAAGFGVRESQRISAACQTPRTSATSRSSAPRPSSPGPPPKRHKDDFQPTESTFPRPAVRASGSNAVADDKPEQPEIDEGESVEDRWQRDKEERDDMAKRIREKEKEKTARQKLPRSKQKADAPIFDAAALKDPIVAAKIGRTETLRDDPMYLERLREEARREYLRGRESEQLELQKRIVHDREVIYKDAPVSSDLKEDLIRQREMVRLASEFVEDRAARAKIEAFEMPESYDADTEKRMGVIHRHYTEAHDSTPRGKPPPSEQKVWEESRTKQAVVRFGAQSDREIGTVYPLLDDDGGEMTFVLGDVTAEYQPPEEDAEFDYNLSRLEREQKAKEKRLKRKDKLQEERKMLPVYRLKDELLDAIRNFPILIIVGETGSGKSTQIPQYLLEAGYADGGKMIGCTQPRRVAAMSVAARVADEMGVKLGHEVGYSIRFEDCTGDKTIVKYMTDGMLLREFIGEPDLEGYSLVMVDEAHERSLHTDVLFGLVKDLTRSREDFKLLISSATLEASKFSQYFDDAPIFEIPGRKYKVEIFYTENPEPDYLEAACRTILQLHVSQDVGDILVFLPGQQEIDEAMELLETSMRGKPETAELIVLPIYSALPSDMQAKIFEPTPPKARKVVLATNIAETSITIDNVVFVIDPGFVKENSYNPKTGMESLLVTSISKASANQRTGRAGRVKPGFCFRLYTKWAYEHELEDSMVPEIQRTNLGNVVLSLMSLGIEDILNFDYIDPPPPATLMKSLELLYALGALNDQGQLTKLGRRMAEFPLDPMYSKMVIHSEKYGCVDECVSICAMLGLQNSVFFRPKDKQMHADHARKNFARPGGDHLTLLNVFKMWEETNYSVNWCYENYLQARSLKRARDVRDQLVDLLDRVDVGLVSNPNDTECIRKAITSGFFTQGARLNKNGSYSTLKYSHQVEIHPQSSLFVADGQKNERGEKKEVFRPGLLVYTELVMTTKEFMRNVIEVRAEWLAEVAPHYYKDLDIGSAKLPKAVGRSKLTDK